MAFRLSKCRLVAALVAVTLLSGCSSKEEVAVKDNPASPVAAEKDNNIAQKGQTKENNSSSKVEKSEIKLVKKQEKAKYLLTNGIEINRRDQAIKTGKGELPVGIIEIKGLVNKTVQSKLNKNIEKDTIEAIQNYSKHMAENQGSFFCESELNANNLLSITIFDVYTTVEGFLYRLTDGKRLYLKDIFTDGTDYVALINRKIREHLAGSSYEEYLLREPFSSIRKDQGFILSERNLTIIFAAGESGFNEGSTINIPLSQIDDYVDAADRYSGTERESHEKTDLIVMKNNIYADDKGDVIKKKNGKLWTHYPVISGTGDEAFEKVINTTIKEGIDEVLKTPIIDNLTAPAEDGSPLATIEMRVSFNHYGILCIKRFVYCNNEDDDLQNFSTAYTFDLRKKEIIKAEAFLDSYFKSNKAAEGAFVKALKGKFKEFYSGRYSNMASEVDGKLNAAFIKDQADLFFEKGHIFESYIIVIIKPKAFDGIPVALECQVPFKDIVSISHEDFFGR